MHKRTSSVVYILKLAQKKTLCFWWTLKTNSFIPIEKSFSFFFLSSIKICWPSYLVPLIISILLYTHLWTNTHTHIYIYICYIFPHTRTATLILARICMHACYVYAHVFSYRNACTNIIIAPMYIHEQESL